MNFGLGFWIWLAVLVIAAFSFHLATCLGGRYRKLHAGILVWVMMALVAIAFWASGWKVGLGALVSAFVIGAIVQVPAEYLARRLMRPSRGDDR